MSKWYRIRKFIEYGIIPEHFNNFTESHHEILEEINTSTLSLDKLIDKYINHASTYGKQHHIFRKIKQKRYVRSHIGVDSNLKPEDIVINEYCPFFNTKIDYRTTSCEHLTKFHYSIDRIDNSKMYMKGNIWVISRFANTIKNDSSLNELKTFSVNILKQIIGRNNI